MKATSDLTDITVFGARGHSLMILRGLEEYWQGRVRIRALIDDIENGFQHPGLGVPVISSDMRAKGFADLPVLLTVTAPGLRRRVAERLEAEGAVLATACCPGQTHVDPDVTYGPGAVSMPWTRIGPGVNVAPRAVIANGTRQRWLQIGDGAEIGVGAAVVGDVAPGARLIGNPALPLRDWVRLRRLARGQDG